MSFTRLAQIGLEHNDTAEYDELGVANEFVTPTISSTKARTGTYSLRTRGTANPRGRGFSSATQLRSGVWGNHAGKGGTTSGGLAVIFAWPTPASNNNYVAWEHGSDELRLIINGTAQDSVSASSVGFTSTNQWFHCGLTLFCNSSTGWASFYLDGTKILSTTATDTSTGVTGMYFSGQGSSAGGWDLYAYFDDFYVDSASSEADATPPLKRFDWAIANGNGSSSQWTGSDGNSTDNYLLVDDTTPDDDTTYVAATTTGLKDTYGMSDITVPTGYVLTAAIPSVLASKAGGAEQLKLLAYDGTNTETSAAQDVAADYDVVWARMATQPDGSAWNETDFNAMEFGIESSI